MLIDGDASADVGWLLWEKFSGFRSAVRFIGRNWKKMQLFISFPSPHRIAENLKVDLREQSNELRYAENIRFATSASLYVMQWGNKRTLRMHLKRSPMEWKKQKKTRMLTLNADKNLVDHQRFRRSSWDEIAVESRARWCCYRKEIAPRGSLRRKLSIN